MISQKLLEDIWREFWEQSGVPVFPADFGTFVACKEIFCRVAIDRIDKEKERTGKIYAGLDVDRIAKLFTIKKGSLLCVDHGHWLKILDDIGAESGEMLLVSLRRGVPKM